LRLKQDSLLFEDLTIYTFLQKNWNQEISNLKKHIKEINENISLLIETLKKKLSNPFDIGIKKVIIKKGVIKNYNKCIENLEKIINEHNNTTSSFYQKVSNAKESLELYYAQKEVKRFKYFDRLKEIENKEQNIINLKSKLPPIEFEITRLEASLTDEVLGAEEFNTKLHRFLNHSDISLKFDKNNKGYKIIRKDGNGISQAKHLSEGEKTAISFVFFLTKLGENEENLKDSIVIIDDPISSFDSNHLFNAYSFIRNICNEVQQLIILTHNFMFFRLIRDWMDKKNDIKKGKIKSSCFNIQAVYKNGVRTPFLQNADETLMKYNSEYHYLFSKLYEYKTKKTLSLEECFLISNITRKVLEIFLKFKFPKRRNDFYALLNEALKDKRYEVAKERIYKFINKYSHGDSIESFDDTIDNIVSESKNIVDDVLKIIRKLDQQHHDELVEIMN
jgi:wobble nucleotide-excising tRNase